MRNQTTDPLYCDHSATTPIDVEVMEIMLRVAREHWGNASSVHQFGRSAKVVLEQAREQIADVLNAARNEIIFTSSGTEADNIILRGTAGISRNQGNHIITSRVEHHAVLHTCEALEESGFHVTYLDVDKYGMVSPRDVVAAITDKTILISIMHANNEIGTINPIQQIGEISRESNIPFHTDTVQSLGKIAIDVNDLPVDALSASGHKIYGPRGIGFLYVSQDLDIRPQLTGGAQERNLRAGTENLPAIAGLAKAVELADRRREKDSERFRAFQQQLETDLIKTIPGTNVHGHPDHRLPGLTNVGWDNVDGESLVMNLDMRGIAVSSGSACSSGSVNPSHVLQALGFSPSDAKCAIRISLGRTNNKDDIPRLVEVIGEEVGRIREARNKRKPSSVDA